MPRLRWSDDDNSQRWLVLVKPSYEIVVVQRYVILLNGEPWMGTSEYRTREDAEAALARRLRIAATLGNDKNY